jgi:hypothetical protein
VLKGYNLANLDEMVRATYELISGPVGLRDTAAIRQLFWPGARMTLIMHPDTGAPQARTLTVDYYLQIVARNSQQEAFYETPLAVEIRQFGGVAQVFSPYEIRNTPDAAPVRRGTNAFQFVFHNGRWWNTDTLWDTETPTNPLPAQR